MYQELYSHNSSIMATVQRGNNLSNKSTGSVPQHPSATVGIHLKTEIVILKNIFPSSVAVKRAGTRCQPLTGKFSFRSFNLCL